MSEKKRQIAEEEQITAEKAASGVEEIKETVEK